jgi:hypothetical protein
MIFAASFLSAPTLNGLATLIFALAAFVTALRTGGKVKNVKSDIQDVHTLVNNQSDRQNARIDQLTNQLTDEGSQIPPRLNGNET